MTEGPKSQESEKPEDIETGATGSDVGTSASLPAWKNPAYRFVFLFMVFLAIVSWLYPKAAERFPEFFRSLMFATAWIEYQILLPFSDDVRLNGSLLAYEGFFARIILECTGVYEMLIFAAAVMAFPTTLRKKAVGLGMGIPMLYFFNVSRILFLILVGAHWHDAFEFMHIYFWQATLILMITSVWLLWIFWVVRDDP